MKSHLVLVALLGLVFFASRHAWAQAADPDSTNYRFKNGLHKKAILDVKPSKTVDITLKENPISGRVFKYGLLITAYFPSGAVKLDSLMEPGVKSIKGADRIEVEFKKPFLYLLKWRRKIKYGDEAGIVSYHPSTLKATDGPGSIATVTTVVKD